jgi:hypothetical protein
VLTGPVELLLLRSKHDGTTQRAASARSDRTAGNRPSSICARKREAGASANEVNGMSMLVPFICMGGGRRRRPRQVPEP